MLHFERYEDLPMDQIKTYKKGVEVDAVQIHAPFRITTWVDGEIETEMPGEAGDYVCIGVKGEIWRVQKDIFEKTYIPIREAYIKQWPDTIVHSAKYVFDKFFKIIEVTFQYKKGLGEFSPEQTRLIFERGTAVAVIVHNTDEDTIELVDQFRVATLHQSGGWITELPAGVVDSNDNAPWVTAYREIKEELGYKVDPEKLEYVMTFYVSPGGTSERISLWYVPVTNADRTEQGGGLEEEGEYITLRHTPIKRIETLLKFNGIMDAKTIIGLQWFMANKT